MYTTIARDTFARQETVRRVVRGMEADRGCAWCGNRRQTKHGIVTGLFQYGTESDGNVSGSAGVSWHSRLFCSKACHDTYHG